MLLAEPARHRDAIAIIGKSRGNPHQATHGLQSKDRSTNDNGQADQLRDNTAGLQKVKAKWNPDHVEHEALNQLSPTVFDVACFATARSIEFRWFLRELLRAVAVVVPIESERGSGFLL
jgi:hypothetical protein